VRIDENAAIGGSRVKSRDHRTGKEYVTVRVQPSAKRLAAAKDARRWWASNRPVLAQTGPLGPQDYGERTGAAPWQRSFQGVRLFHVDDNVIARTAYVAVGDLKAERPQAPKVRVAVS
jgi:hypothetical protein